MNVLVTGGGGQLASALQASCPAGAHAVVLSIDELDITVDTAVEEAIKSHEPEVVINASAYTAVDAAESDEDAARLVNRDGAALLARYAAARDARLVQVSTDFVFGEGADERPRKPSDPTNPTSVYGATKLEGEQVVQEILNDRALVVRTAWLYAANGSNFVNTMLRLMRERGAVRVVADQIGTPTWASSLAGAIWCMLERELSGIHHWTDAGEASWHDFAVAIGELGFEQGLLTSLPKVEAISTSEFPTPAQRPAFSVLDKEATWARLEGTDCLPPVHWRENLATMMKELERG